jgi:two-component system LytT family sensor kinase
MIETVTAKRLRQPLSPSAWLWVAGVALFVILALADAVDYYAAWRAEGHEAPFWRAMLAAFPGWLLWIAVAPLIFFLARRIPLTWPPRPIMLLAHIGLSLLVGAFHSAVHSVAGFYFGLRPSPYAPLEYYELVLLDWLPISMLMYWTLLGAWHALESNRRYREAQLEAAELSRRLTEARLQALTAQLHPHFLFNTLNAAVALVRTGDGPGAVDVLTRLGDILRHLLTGTTLPEVPLGQELAFLKRYLDIERVRFSHRLTIRMDVPKELEDALVPNLILQPLAENALRHGIAADEHAGRIAIEARADDTQLRLLVRNEGPGLPPGWTLEASSGVGLENTRARLRHLHGSSASLDLRDDPDGGVIAEIVLPLRRAGGEANGQGR